VTPIPSDEHDSGELHCRANDCERTSEYRNPLDACGAIEEREIHEERQHGGLFGDD
jgi:hypothetical protein